MIDIKITQFLKKGLTLAQIFEVYEGKIAVFAVSYEQKHLQAQFFEPFHVEILAITRKIRDDQEFAAAGTVADGFHIRKRPQEVLSVFFANLVGFAAHATKNFDSRNHVVAIEPGRQGIFAAAKQDGTVALLGEYAVKIVYPKCDAAPSEKRKRDKEAGENRNENLVPTQIRQGASTAFKNGTLGKVTERGVPAHRKQVQRNQKTKELFALETRNRVFPTEHEEH